MITESGLAKKVTRIQVRSSYLIWISCGSVSSSGFSLVLWLFLIECWKSQVKNQSENLRLWMKLLPPGRTGLFLLLAGRWTRDTDNPKSSSFNRYWNALNQDSRPYEGWLNSGSPLTPQRWPFKPTVLTRVLPTWAIQSLSPALWIWQELCSDPQSNFHQNKLDYHHQKESSFVFH